MVPFDPRAANQSWKGKGGGECCWTCMYGLAALLALALSLPSLQAVALSPLPASAIGRSLMSLQISDCQPLGGERGGESPKPVFLPCSWPSKKGVAGLGWTGRGAGWLAGWW